MAKLGNIGETASFPGLFLSKFGAAPPNLEGKSPGNHRKKLAKSLSSYAGSLIGPINEPIRSFTIDFTVTRPLISSKLLWAVCKRFRRQHPGVNHICLSSVIPRVCEDYNFVRQRAQAGSNLVWSLRIIISLFIYLRGWCVAEMTSHGARSWPYGS